MSSSKAHQLTLLLRNSPLQPHRILHQIQSQIHTNPLLQTHQPLLSHFLTSALHSLGPRHAALFLSHLPRSHLYDSIPLPQPLPSEPNSGFGFFVFFREISRFGVRPEQPVLSALLRVLSGFLENKPGECLHSVILKVGFGGCVVLATGLLDYYSKVGSLELAKKVFDEMPDRDVVANNAMIAALGGCRRLEDARDLSEAMTVRSPASWNSMIVCYCKAGEMGSALQVFEQNPIKDVICWNTMIDGYCKSGELAVARKMFDRLGSAKDAISWNTMISGYVHSRKFHDAVLLFREMQVENVRPTVVTLVCLLSACAHLGALDMGIWIHGYIRNRNLKINVVLGNALIDMYCKCGSVEVALEIFHSMPAKNVYCWNSMIVGLGMHGYGREAIEVFYEMEKRLIKPDGVTFVGLLSGCSHSGLVSEGRNCFSQMLDVYGVEPKIEHYGCMVDLLGRAGLLNEALEFINKMPMKPNCAVWGSLLRACRIHKDTNLSEHVTQRLLALNPDDGGNYVFLSNIYASANRWGDVENCRRNMMEKRVQKIPGCSSIEVDNVVYEFVAGDTSHPLFKEIDSFLDKAYVDLSKFGYKPDMESVLHDIEDEEKENAVKYHSEKLAVAFGLMSIGGLKPIRIVKNLRVCCDCHEVLKLMAKIFRREIIVRDRNRFHHFRGGSCSCNDYW